MYAQYVVMSTTANNHHQFAQFANNQPQNSKKYLMIEPLKKNLLLGSKKSKIGSNKDNPPILKIDTKN
jgi:hypothetical protein